MATTELTIEERMTLIKECIEYKDPIGVKKLILEDKLNDDSTFWELISLLGDAITDETFEACPGFIDVCERCMTYIVNVGNPKELLLALLEQADTLTESVKFHIFLQLIQKVLLKLPSKLSFSLELALETLSQCVSELELPSTLELEEEESKWQELCPVEQKTNHYISCYLDFLAPFVEKVANQSMAVASNESNNGQIVQASENEEKECRKMKKMLEKYLLLVLGQPLVYFDLCQQEQAGGLTLKSNARVSAEKVMTMLLALNKSVYAIIDKALRHKEEVQRRLKWRMGDADADVELDTVPTISLSCLIYLTLVEELVPLNAPCLVSKQGILEMCLPFIQLLVSHSATEVRKKGVRLLKVFISNQTDAIFLGYDDLDRPQYFAILGSMFDIMIHSSVKLLRQDCIQLVPVFIQLFTLQGRYQILYKIFGTIKHAGALGFCVQLLKQQMDEILAKQWTGCSHIFCGMNLKRLFLLITSLSEGAATDLVENSDRIISVLNLIRYLVLKDPPHQNATGFWDFHRDLEKGFLALVREGLAMSKGHYRMEVDGLERGNRSTASNDESVEMSVSVAGFRMPKMARGQKVAIMKQALNTLELITSLLVRVDELLDQPPQR